MKKDRQSEPIDRSQPFNHCQRMVGPICGVWDSYLTVVTTDADKLTNQTWEAFQNGLKELGLKFPGRGTESGHHLIGRVKEFQQEVGQNHKPITYGGGNCSRSTECPLYIPLPPPAEE